ncbi:MAG: pilus assembly protein PilP [Burkholderiaceae bacterium]
MKTHGSRAHQDTPERMVKTGLRKAPLLGALVASVLLVGCDSNIAEIDVWMEEVRATTPPVRTTLEEPKRFSPFYYDLVEELPPFSPIKLAALQDPMQVRAKGGLAPDVNRRREVLENFPLEQIQMVGFMRSSRYNTALLQVENTIYQARIGNYAGQNYGVVTNIGETEVALRELVQDATGDWVERETVLKLQEKGQ